MKFINFLKTLCPKLLYSIEYIVYIIGTLYIIINVISIAARRQNAPNTARL